MSSEKRRKRWYLSEILRYTAEVANGEAKAKSLLQELLRDHPGDDVIEQALACMKLGRKFRQCREEAFRLGKEDNRSAFDELMKQFLNMRHDMVKQGVVNQYLMRLVQQYRKGFEQTHPHLPIPSISIPNKQLLGKQTTEQKRGKILEYYADRNMGFLLETLTGQIWDFSIKDILDENLSKSLSEGQVYQEVRFTGDINSGDGKHPAAQNLELVSADEPASTKTQSSLTKESAEISQDNSFFAKAKTAEKSGQIQEAQNYYSLEIKQGPESPHYKDAIKDMASLLNRTDGRAAAEFLEKYSEAFTRNGEIRAVNQMKARFYIHAREFIKAAPILRNIADSRPRNSHLRNSWQQIYNSKRHSCLLQEAYCYFADGQYEESIKKLNDICKEYFDDPVSAALLRKVKDAQILKEKPRDLPPEDLLIFEEFSILAKLRLGIDKLDDIEAGTAENGSLSFNRNWLFKGNQKSPVSQSKHLKDAQYALNNEGDFRYNYIRSKIYDYFLEQAEGEVSKDIVSLEVIRCYALEVLQLTMPQEQQSSRAWSLVVLSYFEKEKKYQVKNALPPIPLFSALFKYPMQNYEISMISHLFHSVMWGYSGLSNLLKALQEEPNSWNKFVSDLGFLYSRAYRVSDVLEDALNKIGAGDLLKDMRISSNFHQEDAELFALFDDLSKITANKFSQIREAFLQVPKKHWTELEQARISVLQEMLGYCSDYAGQHKFADKERWYFRIKDLLDSLLKECAETPTTLSIEKIYPALKKIQSLLIADFQKFQTQEPEFELKNVDDNNSYVLGQDGMLSLKLLLSFVNESAPAVESLRIFPEDASREFNGGEFLGLMEAGSKEIELNIKPTPQEIQDNAFSIRLKIEYRSSRGELKDAGSFAVPVQLGKPMTEEITNVYYVYASGAYVDDDNMFFGRDELVEEICKYLSQYSGQCFVLYGQKRSGKTSVLRHVGKKLPKNCVFTTTSASTFTYNGDKIIESFVKAIYRPVVRKFKDLGIPLPEDFPSYEEAKSDSIQTLYRISMSISQQNMQWVIAVDEFTNIYANKSDETAAFMHAWKSFLEDKLFSALIIGQDTMPRFKKEYPNDFCVAHDKRITFLSWESSCKLATQPILLDGKSRYRGNALEAIYRVTAGSPYFLQKVCSEIVKYLNKRQQPYITEADVDNVIDSMVRGENRLKEEVFDELVTAGDERNAWVPRKQLWSILTKIALQTGDSGWCSVSELEDIENADAAIKDLHERDILVLDGDKLRIKVELFTKWLKINWRGV